MNTSELKLVCHAFSVGWLSAMTETLNATEPEEQAVARLKASRLAQKIVELSRSTAAA
jgi:hypothetical protein